MKGTIPEKIRFRNVSKSYNGHDVLKDVSISVGAGETLVLIGTSGSGKTTTLKMINRLVEPTEGNIVSPPSAQVISNSTPSIQERGSLTFSR